MRKSIVAAAMAASLLAGGAVGVALFGPGGAGAQTPPASLSTPAAAPNQNGTAPKSNEDTSHESGESAQREADEDAGRASFGRHGGGSNEDTTHESSESQQREQQENSQQAQPNAPTTTTTAG
jgi:hypothetical protein